MLRNNDVENLRDDLAGAIKRARIIEPALATRVAGVVLERLQQRYGGRRLYIPAASRQLEGLKEARNRGDSRRAICKNLGISRSTYYRLLKRISVGE